MHYFKLVYIFMGINEMDILKEAMMYHSYSKKTLTI